MNVLLVEPKVKRGWGKNNQYVGLLRIGNWAKSIGHEVQYVRHPDLPTFQPDEVYVTSMFTYSYPEVWAAIRQYKFLYPTAHHRLGGIYATICPDHARQSGTDEVMVGRHPEAKDFPPDPSLLPRKQDFAYLFTSYGCDRACTFCATHIINGDGITQSSVDTVLREVRFLAERGFKEIRLGDDSLLYNADNHIKLICEELIRADLGVTLLVPGGLAALDFTPEIASLMWRAGFRRISFSLESVDSHILNKMGRGMHTHTEELTAAVGYAEDAGFNRWDTGVYFLIGAQYQSLKSMIDTLNFLLDLGVWAYPQRLTPIPNTVEWKRMSLEKWDYADLYYGSFVAPDQDAFNDHDLKVICKIARSCVMGRKYSGFNWLGDDSRVSRVFKEGIR